MPPVSVLVVDDDVALQTTIIKLLEDEGYTAQGAGDGPTALRLIERAQPDVVFLDMHLPGMDGPQVARSIKEQHPGSKIVVLTAAQDARSTAEKIGADGYVAKPFALLRLLRTLEQVDGERAA